MPKMPDHGDEVLTAPGPVAQNMKAEAGKTKNEFYSTSLLSTY